ncbi:MAG: HIT domain-containing protein [Chitinispirillaceae bacterium]|nr:HIT domain-containing protein [Chitinispirillaceae bacterium]
MDQLWAPWRMSYISGIDSQKNKHGCTFCDKITADNDRADLVLHRGRECFVIMNLYPYNNGHLMVIPFRHVADICALEHEESAELWELVCLSKHLLGEAYHPDGYNIGINQGRTAGAGIDSHMHVHIVPRWNGDTNFMPVVGETKVLSQSLEDTYDTLLPRYRSIAGSSSCSCSDR